MRIRALPVIIRAVQTGVTEGLILALEEGRKPEHTGNPNVISEIVTNSVLDQLINVVDFGDDLQIFRQTVNTDETQK